MLAGALLAGAANPAQADMLSPAQNPSGKVTTLTGDLVINGTAIAGVNGNYDLAAQGSAIAAQINNVSMMTGISASADAVSGAITLSSAAATPIELSTNNGIDGATRVENATGLDMVSTAVNENSTNTLTFTGSVSTATFTLTTNLTGGEAITVGGITYTEGVDFTAGGNGTATAANLAAAIDSDTGSGSQLDATSIGNTIVLTSRILGDHTTNVALSAADAKFDINSAGIVAGSGFSSGASVAIGTSIFTFSLDGSGGNFDVSLNVGSFGTHNDLAANFSAAVADVRASEPAGTQFTSTAVGNTVILASDLFGGISALSVDANNTDVAAISGLMESGPGAVTDGNLVNTVMVPTLSQWAQFLLALLVGAAGIHRMRRYRKKQRLL
jgi:hypothetical protein